MMILIASSLGVAMYLAFTYQVSTQVSNMIDFYRYRNEVLGTRFKVTWFYYNGNVLTLYVYNYGDRDIYLDSVYIDGARIPLNNIEVSAEYVREINISLPLSTGNHIIKLVSKDGVGYEFMLKI